MSKAQTNFLGIKVTGDITRVNRTDQRPQSEFEPFVKAVLDDPLILKFGWRQYTPYFNDGDECVFGASGLWVLTTKDKLEDEDGDELEDDEIEETYGLDYGSHPTLGGFDGPFANRVYKGSHQESWERARALSEAIEGGEFDNVLLDLFGDHATVVVSRDGIEVETYEHD